VDIVDPSVRSYIVDCAVRGIPPHTVHNNLVQAAVRSITGQISADADLKLKLFADRRFLPTAESVRHIMNRSGSQYTSKNDAQSLQSIIADYPGRLQWLNEYNRNVIGSSTTDPTLGHFNLSIMSSSGMEAYQRYGANGLVVMDGTHKTSDKGYMLHTVMTIDVQYNEPHIVGHLLTSDMSEKSLSMWLKTCVQGEMPAPREVLVDKGTVEAAAIRSVWPEPNTHYRLCLFHLKKACAEHARGTRVEKAFLSMLLSKLYFSVEDFSMHDYCCSQVVDELSTNNPAQQLGMLHGSKLSTS
jgi:hypothetical protein